MFNDNSDFYPTPSHLASRMINKIEWKDLNSVLEPSAGSGTLLETIHNKFNSSQYHYKKNKYNIDAIEIDTNLQSVLKSKGHRVIYNDFLNFFTYKSYDCIIANFPFSAGDKHALKAINLIESQYKPGQLCFILNAETLRNPYSNIRKELVKKLEDHNADVEFIENSFSEAERKTNVEVALVYLKVNKVNDNSILLDELKKEETYYTSNSYESDKLIQSDFIRGIVDQYNYEVRAGLKLIDEFNKIKPYMMKGFEDNDSSVLKLELEYKDDENSLENGYVNQIRLKYWKALFSNDQFIGLFTSNLRRKYMEQLEELKNYDFSLYNIYSIRVELSKEMVKGVEETILDLFEEFSHKHHYYDEQSKNIHYFNGWATNKAFKINKKVIIPLNAYYDMQYSWGRYEPSHYRVLDKLKDIEKVFNYLDDGKTEEIDITETLKMAEHYGETRKIDLKYFYITFYKKGTAHIEFKNLNLLQKFNLFGSNKRGWLPPSYGNVKYKDMTKEEKSVIDQFEGEQSYNKVLNNKKYFIMDTTELLKLTS